MIIQSVKRATDIISLFTSAQPSLGITQIAAALELNKATAWGLVTTLEQQGFLKQDPSTLKYSIGSKLFELGMVYMGSLEINARASRRVQDLANRTEMNARVGIWDNGSVLVTLSALPKSEDSLSHQLGPRVPAYCSAIGKVLLANIDPEQLNQYLSSVELVRHTRNTICDLDVLRTEIQWVKEHGYCVSREEMITGVMAIGAPVFSRGGRLEGGVSISSNPGNVAERTVERLAEELLRTAAEISQELGYYSI